MHWIRLTTRIWIQTCSLGRGMVVAGRIACRGRHLVSREDNGTKLRSTALKDTAVEP